MVGLDYTALSCPTASVSYATIYRKSRDLGTVHQDWPLANSAHRLAFGQTYSVQPRLPMVATIGPASLIVGPDYSAPSCPTDTVWKFLQNQIKKNGWQNVWVAKCLG